MSRVGKKSITLPDKVTVKVNGSSVQVEGPKGKLSWTLPEGITATVEGNQLSVDRAGESRQLRALHGTNRSLLNNMVIGVSEGFVKNLEIVGVGFRAAVKGNILDLNLGKSHPINNRLSLSPPILNIFNTLPCVRSSESLARPSRWAIHTDSFTFLIA